MVDLVIHAVTGNVLSFSSLKFSGANGSLGNAAVRRRSTRKLCPIDFAGMVSSASAAIIPAGGDIETAIAKDDLSTSSRATDKDDISATDSEMSTTSTTAYWSVGSRSLLDEDDGVLHRAAYERNRFNAKRRKERQAIRKDVHAASIEAVSVDDVAAPTKLELEPFEHDVRAALRSHCDMSGLHRFDRERMTTDEQLRECVLTCMKEAGLDYEDGLIISNRRQKMISERVASFNKKCDYQSQVLLACAACGVEDFIDDDINHYLIPSTHSCLQALTLSPVQLTEYLSESKTNPMRQRLRSVSILPTINENCNKTDCYFYLHPELIRHPAFGKNKYPLVPLCGNCLSNLHQGKKGSIYSIANGYDFGNWSRLFKEPAPLSRDLLNVTMLEQLCIQRVIIHTQIIKLTAALAYESSGTRDPRFL